ncbi:hypothetical protein WA158_000280 [Blastocystis sp. Blastoise]
MSDTEAEAETQQIKPVDAEDKRKVVIVLESACLETVKTKKGYVLLNSDDHKSIHKKMGKDPATSRPDITHQMLLTLLDSPLNKKGYLQVYIRTEKNVLIEVNPKIRIPRTYKRFAGLMVQLLHKLKIRSAEGSQTLMKVIKNPVTSHLPIGARRIGTSVTGALVDPIDLVSALPDNEPIVFVFGAIAHGHINLDYVEETVSFSKYPLSGSVAVGKLMNAFEHCWDIL